MKIMMAGAAALALVFAGLSPALAQSTTQFMVSGAPVNVGAQPANAGKGYSVYHYRSIGPKGAVSVNCSCDGAKASAGTCDTLDYYCDCPSAKLTCSGAGG